MVLTTNRFFSISLLPNNSLSFSLHIYTYSYKKKVGGQPFGQSYNISPSPILTKRVSYNTLFFLVVSYTFGNSVRDSFKPPGGREHRMRNACELLGLILGLIHSGGTFTRGGILALRQWLHDSLPHRLALSYSTFLCCTNIIRCGFLFICTNIIF